MKFNDHVKERSSLTPLLEKTTEEVQRTSLYTVSLYFCSNLEAHLFNSAHYVLFRDISMKIVENSITSTRPPVFGMLM